MAESHGLAVDVLGIGVLGPGLGGWPQTCAVLRGDAAYVPAATSVPPPQRLPATERRRAGTIIKVSIVAADEALAMSGCDASHVATVFSASEGDGRNCHEICEALASGDRLISPTRFTNSVHNAPAGYWHIATHSMAASTSLCAYDASFAMGLLEAALQARLSRHPVLLVVADAPYPDPLHATRPLPDSMAIAIVLGHASAHGAFARLTIETRRASDRQGTDTSQPFLRQAQDGREYTSGRTGSGPQPFDTSGRTGWGSGRTGWGSGRTASEPRADIDALTHALPVARGLPLLEAIARGGASSCVIEGFDDLALHVSVFDGIER